jgi:hypothetical protein
VHDAESSTESARASRGRCDPRTSRAVSVDPPVAAWVRAATTPGPSSGHVASLATFSVDAEQSVRQKWRLLKATMTERLATS